MKADLPQREPAILNLWEKENVYAQALSRRQGKPSFVLHDGPPYANGHLHLGHALNKILKDIIVRSKTMAGFYAPYVPGWDCHGLPIELQLMKEKKVADKNKVDRAQFRQEAKAFASRFVEIQKQEFKRMGVQGDWNHPYLTMDENYKKVIVETFKDLERKGYVYRGKKPVYWCPTDETALAEAEVEYENDTGPSIFVAFPRVDASNEYFVIWTTTPWTLPANLAIAVDPEALYVRWQAASGGTFIVAEKLLDAFQSLAQLKGVLLERLPGRDLLTMKASHPWINRQVRILPAGFVAMDTGTGLVHIAPGHGREDYQLGQAQKPPLPILSPVNDRGLFTDEVPEWKGEHVFKANAKIIEFLRSRGRLLYSSEITHSYPHCWRCHRPVIFRATEQWFLSVEKDHLRERLLEALKSVEFFPDYGRNRITGMIETRPDWCLSRQRLWGTEIPASASSPLVGEDRGGGNPPSHPSPTRGEGAQDPDIFDVWFESGVSWAAVLKNSASWPELRYPADMYLEGSDQHRGWFQVSLIPSVALEGQAPFKSLLTHGFVMDGEGRPMSKSLGNVIAPEEIIKQFGADILRLWVAASDYGGDVRLSADILKSQAESYRKVRNTLRYILNNLADFEVGRDKISYEKLPEIDRWALHRLQEETRDALTSYGRYEFYRVVSRLVSYCVSDLSGFYLDVLKDRLYCETPTSFSRRSAQTVLHEIASNLIRLLAPILSFTMDECWRFLGAPGAVALEDFPAPNSKEMDQELNENWKQLLTTRGRVLAELEMSRAQGIVKAPREAKAILRFTAPERRAFFGKYKADLAMIMGVSQVDLSEKTGESDADIQIEKSSAAKCARCWIYKSDVGSIPAWTDLCVRCARAVEDWQQTHS